MPYVCGGIGRYLVLLLGIGAVIVSLIGGATASAAPILVIFSGTVTVSTVPGISGGAPYSGEFLYDTTDPLLSFSAPYEFYRFGPNDLLSITVGNCTFSGGGPGTDYPNNILIVHQQVLNGGAVGDVFNAEVISSATSNCQLFSPSVLYFEIVGPSGLVPGSGVPSSFDLSKVVQPTYSDFGSRAGGLIPGNQFFYGDFNSIHVNQVPEPSTGMLLIWILPVLGIVMVRSRGLEPPRDCSRWLIKTFTDLAETQADVSSRSRDVGGRDLFH